ncbi:MAG: HigA family addiction module antitoxin [Bacteroidales bacterium]|jgi:addiction module HigA family antidote|nr:HigA family addiction module antitoxin [Bacteroidales bacterium]
MLPEIDIVKGIHPGLILERELIGDGIKKSHLAKDLGVSTGLITDIVKQRRGINPSLSIRLGKALNVDPAYFSLLQTYYELRSAQRTSKTNPPFHFRPALFWDINPAGLDFEQHKNFIVVRVFERGNEEEIKAIIEYYGRDQISLILKGSKNLLYTALKTARKYLEINLEKV